MAQAQPSLDTFIKNNRRFIKIKDGDTFQGIYRGFKVAMQVSFGEEREVVSYMLQEKGTEKVTPWQNSSIAVAEQMKKFSVGEEIRIKRIGSTAKDTKYEITSDEE